MQADELCINVQGDKVWVATAMSVRSRFFIWACASTSRNAALVRGVMIQVKKAASSSLQHLLIAVDGFSAYLKVIGQVFHTKLYTGKKGHPRELVWKNLQIVQVVKSRSGRKFQGIKRYVVRGTRRTVDRIIAKTQEGKGSINTAFVERLNATFRSRIPGPVRRTRCLARTIEHETFWSGVVYNFCTIHHSPSMTPTMAAQLTNPTWPIEELLRTQASLR